MTNYEQGRAYMLSSLSQECLHTPERFSQWADGLIAAFNKPVEQPKSQRRVVIYTDGACSGNPGPGGWGVVLTFGDKQKEISGAVADTTNNRMELLAVIQALSALKHSCYVTIHSDSAYVVRCFHEGWVNRWQSNGWLNSQKKPVENRDLWEEFVKLVNMHHVEFIKVKGHSNDALNNRCDQLAVAAYKALKNNAAD